MNSEPIPAKKRRWMPRFSLRTLIVVMTVAGLSLGFFGNYLRRLYRQRQIATKINEAGGIVVFDYELRWHHKFESVDDLEEREITYDEAPDETPPGPKLLRDCFGNDLFASVEGVIFGVGQFDSGKSIEALPKDLLELPKLKWVDLDEPRINNEWLRCLATSPQLEALGLNADLKVDATKDDIAQLQLAKNLKRLVLSGYWITDETIDGVAKLRQLKSLYLQHVPHVTSAIFSKLDDLTNLEELSIFKATKIDDQGNENLRRLKTVRKLTIMTTPISDATMVHLSTLTQLEQLHLPWTHVGDPGTIHLVSLRNLRHLNLYHANVSDAGLESISQLKHLRYLCLSGTKVTDAGMPMLARLTQLESLELPDSVHDDGLKNLYTLSKLRRLFVGRHVSKEAIDALEKALPKCKITVFK